MQMKYSARNGLLKELPTLQITYNKSGRERSLSNFGASNLNENRKSPLNFSHITSSD
jgi:hypothetical protein